MVPPPEKLYLLGQFTTPIVPIGTVVENLGYCAPRPQPTSNALHAALSRRLGLIWRVLPGIRPRLRTRNRDFTAAIHFRVIELQLIETTNEH